MKNLLIVLVKHKIKLLLFLLIILAVITNAINPSSRINKPAYISPPTEYTFSQSNLPKKMPEIIDKMDLIPVAAGCVKGSIVHITTGKANSYTLIPQKTGINVYKPLKKRSQSLGSGVIVSSDGYILTNNHVIENFPRGIKVELGPNRRYPAKIIGKDPKTDLAVMKIDAENLSHLAFGNSDEARVGDIVLAAGNPFGIGESVTMGIISATGRSNIGILEYEDFIQTDAVINPGNSGGALINLKGELIGINTAVLTRSGGYEGIGFAIPSNMVNRIFKEIASKGRVERGWIGVAIQDIGKIKQGVIIVDVVSGSPANDAGLKRGDVLISADNRVLRDKSHLRNAVARAQIGDSIEFRVFRKGKVLEIPVAIAKLPDDTNFFDIKSFSFPAK